MEGAVVQQALEASVLRAVAAVEERLDAQLQQLERLDDDDLEALRRRRLDDLKRLHAKREEWAARGHGALGEVVEREFFKEMKGEERAVVLFYRSSPPCLAMERALRALAPKHMETRFVRVEAEKAPFLTQRLRVWMLPTLAILKDGAATDYIVGLDDVGGREDFADEALEARLAALGAVFEEAQPRAAAAAREGGGGGGGGGGSGGVRQGGERRRADSDEDSDFD